LPRLLAEVALGRGDGSYSKTLAKLAKTAVLVIDDWALPKLTDEGRRTCWRSLRIVTSRAPR
jgi:DNA replication protein DnaC